MRIIDLHLSLSHLDCWGITHDLLITSLSSSVSFARLHRQLIHSFVTSLILFQAEKS